jgi:hypothetical protein
LYIVFLPVDTVHPESAVIEDLNFVVEKNTFTVFHFSDYAKPQKLLSFIYNSVQLSLLGSPWTISHEKLLPIFLAGQSFRIPFLAMCPLFQPPPYMFSICAVADASVDLVAMVFILKDN